MKQEDKLFPKRNRLEVISSILSHCNIPSKKSRIVYQCNLNFKQIKTYLIFLTDMGFLKVINKEMYQTTEKGRELNKKYQHIKNLMVTSKTNIRVENVVTTATLKQRIDLNLAIKAFPNIEYHKQFPLIVFRLKKPKTTTLIFSSGKMICTGAPSEMEAKKALRKILRILKKEGVIIEGNPELKVVNIVASADLRRSVDLLNLYESETTQGGRIIYEPEQFPGLIYRIKDSKIVLLIHSSGKVLCLGAKKVEDVYNAVNKLQDKIEERKNSYEQGF